MPLCQNLSDRLRQVGLRRSATSYVTLLAGFAALVARVSGQSDVVIGTPVAGRDHPKVQDLIGFFVNTHVLRMDLANDPTYSELVAQVGCTGELLSRKQRALRAHSSQTRQLEALVGPDVYQAWWSTESFVAASRGHGGATPHLTIRGRPHSREVAGKARGRRRS
jgi:hypothetical protein